MEKRQILRELLRKGIQPTPEELDRIGRGEAGLSDVKKEEKSKSGFSVAVSEIRERNLSAGEFVKIYNKRFDVLRDMILKKVRATSISNAEKIFSRTTVVGRVGDLTPSGFLLEDVTGETEVVAEENEIRTGDVIGVTGRFREGKFFPEEIIYPDIPLTRDDPRLEDVKITFATRVPESAEEGIVVCPGKCPGGDNVITGIPDPGWVIIKRGDKTARILVMKSKNRIDEKDVLSFMRRRTLPESGNLDLNNVIWEVPDILWIFENGRDWTRNYKGVVIISTAPRSYAEYDASNNDIRFGKT